jgi:hypothetical protein
MKISLALGQRREISRQTALGCLTTNLALPGFGSLVAGRVSGYAQAALSVGGTILTTVFGVRCIVWFLSNWSRLRAPQADPVAVLDQMWLSMRWAVLGIGIFAVAWIWALGTSLAILRGAKKSPPPAPPPLL